MLKRLSKNKGAVTVFSAIIMVVVIGFAALGVDTGYMYTARNQLQNAVDSAAMAAASKLDIANNNAAVISTAKTYASNNLVLGQPVVLQDSDIEVFNSGNMGLRRVRVTGHLTSARGNPVNLLFARVLGYDTVDITASAMAGLIANAGAPGIRPWAIRDDCWDPDDNAGSDDAVNCEFGYPNVGDPVTLKFGAFDDREEPYWFAPVALPPVVSNYDAEGAGNPDTGANSYRNNVKYGYDDAVGSGDILRVEPGNVSGPTNQGVNYVQNLDPGATWDPVSKTVVNSDPMYANTGSPRIVTVVFYDPAYGVQGSPGNIKVTRLGAFFLDTNAAPGAPANTVSGYFMHDLVSGGTLDTNSQSGVYGVGLLE